MAYDWCMGAATQTLYDTDFAEWADRTAELLRARRFADVDWESVVEEIETLGRSERDAVRSQARRVIEQFLKLQYSPAREPRQDDGSRESEYDSRLPRNDDVDDGGGGV